MSAEIRLARRIQYGAMILMALLALGLFLLLDRQRRDAQLEHAEAELSERAELSASRITQAVRTLSQDVLFLSRTPPVAGIRRAKANGGIDPRDNNPGSVWEWRMGEIFTAFLEAHPDYYQARYIGIAQNHRELVRAELEDDRVVMTPKARLQSHPDPGFLMDALKLPEQTVLLSALDLSQEDGKGQWPPKRTLRAATPVYTPEGAVFGAIVINMDVVALLTAASEKPPYQARVYITDEHGRYLGHPDPSKAFTFDRGRHTRLPADLPTLAGDYDLTQKHPQRLRPTLFEGRAAHVLSRKVHFDPARPARFLLLTYVVPDAHLRQEGNEGLIGAMLISLLAALAGGGFLLLLLQRAFSPLQQLTRDARAIADGDLAQPVSASGGGEVGLLAATLEQLRRNVAARETELMQLNTELDERVRARTAELRLAASVIENTSEGVIVTNERAVIIAVNPAFTRITSYLPEEAIGHTPALLKSDHQDAGFYRQMWRDLESNGHWSGDIWNRRRDGEAYLERLTINRIPGEAAEPVRYVGVFNDVTELRRKDEYIQHLAFHDALTGLPNRALLQDRLSHAIHVAEREARRVAVMLMDLDRFKAVNDTLGHHIGDQLLQEVARRMLAQLRATDTVARMGGDEFVILLEQQNEPEHCAAVAQGLIDAVSATMEIGGHRAQVGASIGIAFYPDDGDDLLRHADAAMYAAKHHGRGVYRFFQDSMAPLAALHPAPTHPR